MGKDFSLLQQLDKERLEPTPKLPSGIKYQEYIINVENEKQTILIPIRESEVFEKELSMHDKYIDRDYLRVLLRTYRGIRLDRK